jgi:A/G-specific adenine glycosylase
MPRIPARSGDVEPRNAALAAAPARASAPPTSEIIPAAELYTFQTQLLGWFAGAKRDLDWRRTRDAYRVWISEIMLQQTRVAAVLPYYQRFLARFPTIDALARARLDAVLRWWAGLGYYSRARNLHRAAKEMVARHGGKFPRGIEEALALPGIGHYTAAAVLSIAYGEPHAVLDGNVARVLARLGAMRGDLRRPKRWRELAAAANALLPAPAGACGRGSTEVAPAASAPTAGAGDWNQAMMELGATLCTPRAPHCAACPVSRWCRARALGIALRLPAPRRKPKPVRLVLSAAVLLDPRGRTLLLRQKSDHTTVPRTRHSCALWGSSSLFSSLWHFPAIQAARPAPEKLSRYLQSAFGITTALELLPPARHTVTFRRILLAPFLVRVSKLPAIDVSASSGVRTPRLAKIERLPISSATKKIAAAARAAIADV